MSRDLEAVRAVEHAGWQRAAPAYGATFARAASGFIDALLDAARVGAGKRLLDLACGPGLVANAARSRGAEPVGLDFSAAMIALARAAYPTIRFEEGDAEASSFAVASFDVVVSNFGIHHMPDPVRSSRDTPNSGASMTWHSLRSTRACR
jgi:SAM-dependent methyltransferase